MKKIVFIIFSVFLSISSYAQIDSLIGKKKLKIGIKNTPPFTIIQNQGNNPIYKGISVELWELIADELKITKEEYEFVQYDLVQLLSSVENGEIDLCINPFTVTSDRLRRFDFTQPFYKTNLAIAKYGKEENSVILILSNIFSLNFLKAIIALIGIIFFFGFLVWLSERGKNQMFEGGIKGIGNGIWWSAVTMTTVGYGDKTPKTTLGRTITIIWMFTSIIIISSLTASITSALTINRYENTIKSVQDLKKLKVGTIESSSSQDFLRKNGIAAIGYQTIDEAFEALKNQNLEVLIYDEPILKYLIKKNNVGDKIMIDNKKFNSQYYSFALPKNHQFLDIINPVLLHVLEGNEWKGIVTDNLE